MTNTMPETPIMTECLQDSPDPHTELEMPTRHLAHQYLQQIQQVPRTPQTKALEWEMPARHPQLHYNSG